MPAKFPSEVQTTLLGTFVLEGLKFGDGELFRIYSADGPRFLQGSEVRVIAWPPESGITDPAKFGAFIDEVWHRLSTSLAELVRVSLPIIETSILDFCEPGPDYTPPTAERLMETASLRMVKINGQGERDIVHEIMFHDDADLIGGHDIIIQLSADLKPVSAQMDG